jgi:uncharacterized protein
MKRTIIIMAKVPIAGTVKTRLQPFLSPEKCAELATAFLGDTESKAKNACENTILAYSPAAQRNILKKILRYENTLIEQKGKDLGEKMLNAFEFVFRQNPDSAVVMIGTDSPTLPAECIEEAFKALEDESKIVLGKTEDGGFYLIGLKQSLPGIFEGIKWSTSMVYTQLIKNIENLKIDNLKLIPTWYDVDNAGDLERLYGEVAQNKKIQESAPRTYEWLASNSEIFD